MSRLLAGERAVESDLRRAALNYRRDQFRFRAGVMAGGDATMILFGRRIQFVWWWKGWA